MAPLSGGSVSYFNLLFQIVVHLGTVGVLSIGGGGFCILSLQCPLQKTCVLHVKIFTSKVVLLGAGGAFKRQVKGYLTTE